ncbi:MAG: hypothetical protein WBW25_05490 [Halobacteriota archaeon]
MSEGKDRVALKALEVELRQIELMAKLTGQLNKVPQVNFSLSPEYVQFMQVLMRVLEPYPEVREAISQALLEADAATKGGGNGRNGEQNEYL